MIKDRCDGAAVTIMSSVCAGIIAMLSGGEAAADILRVPSEYPTIQAGIDAASDGDKVLVDPGTYDGPIRFYGKAITVQGVSNNLGGPPQINSTTAVVRFVDGESLSSTIDNFTIIGGEGPIGGGIKVSNSCATIKNCTVQGTARLRGGAICVEFGCAKIENTFAIGQTQFGAPGGGLCAYESNVDIENSFFEGLSSGPGGAVAAINSSVSLDNVTFGNNPSGIPFIGAIANGSGGGLYASNSTVSTITSCSFQGCAVQGAALATGGGIALIGSTLGALESTTFTGCSASAQGLSAGGGLFSDTGLGNTVPIGCSFTGCSAVSVGGDLDGDGIPETDGVGTGGAICFGIYAAPGGKDDEPLSCDPGLGLTVKGCSFAGNIAGSAYGEDGQAAFGDPNLECLFPDGIAQGGNIRVCGDLLVYHSTFHEPPPLAGGLSAGGTAQGSLGAEGGGIWAGTGNITLYNTTMNDCRANGAVVEPLQPSGSEEPEPCEEFHWEGYAQGGAIWTEGRVSLYNSIVGFRENEFGDGVPTAFGCSAQAITDAAGGGIYALGGVDLIVESIEDGAECRVHACVAVSTNEIVRFYSFPNPVDDADGNGIPQNPIGGGGIYAGDAGVVTDGAEISLCRTNHNGGGIYCGSLNANNTDFILNDIPATDPEFPIGVCCLLDPLSGEPRPGLGMGGAVYVWNDDDPSEPNVELFNCNFLSNSSQGDVFRPDPVDEDTWFEGGGGALTTSGSIVMNQIELDANGGRRGGGIYAVGGITANNVTAVSNVAQPQSAPESQLIDISGGAITAGGDMVISNSLFEGNLVSNPLGASLGGTLCAGGSVSVTNCEFRKSWALGAFGQYPGGSAAGGAIFGMGVSATDSSFYLNSATGDVDANDDLPPAIIAGPVGGSIASEGSLNLDNCDFKRDFVLGFGGCVWVSGPEDEDPADIMIDRTTIQYTSADASGGAIDASNIGIAMIIDSTFDDNSAADNGGAINIESAVDLAINDCYFRRNSTLNGNGGGINIGGVSSNYVISQTAFGANSAGDLGGGFYTEMADGQSILVNDCTLVCNSATNDGGGFFVNGGSIFEGAGLRIESNNFSDNNPNNFNDDQGNVDDCNGVPEKCGNRIEEVEDGALDCNQNGCFDEFEIIAGLKADCNVNGIPDDCDIADGTSGDADGNGVPDECVDGDCDGDGIPDSVEIGSGKEQDCNNNDIPDSCDIASGESEDCDENGVPDECDLAEGGTAEDCNGNGDPDSCDIADGFSLDCNANNIPDECELADGSAPDCNGNEIPDACDIASGFSEDCNGNTRPDECEVADGSVSDCNDNGRPDDCDIAGDFSLDCNGNKTPDECDVADGTSPDCNGNNAPDDCDIADGTSIDCNLNEIPDDCDLADGTAEDCNENLVPDECDIQEGGGSSDQDENGIPDECECIGDVNFDGLVNGADLSALLGSWGEPDFDLNGDGIVDGLDLSILLGTWGICP